MSRKILVVEDEKDTIALFEDVLILAGYDVQSVMDVKSAIKSIEKSNPDLILLDIFLPDETGVEFINHLYKSGLSKNIPIIVITAYSSFDMFYDYSKLPGVKRCLFKPCRPRVMLKSIKEVLKNDERKSECN